jgi:aldehyde dehydrogenase family 7 protein A1
VSQGGKILYGGKVIDGPGNFVMPTISSISHDAQVVQHEVFVPIVHAIKFQVLQEGSPLCLN